MGHRVRAILVRLRAFLSSACWARAGGSPGVGPTIRPARVGQKGAGGILLGLGGGICPRPCSGSLRSSTLLSGP